MVLFFHKLEMVKYGGRVYSCSSVYMFKASIKRIIEAFFFSNLGFSVLSSVLKYNGVCSYQICCVDFKPFI